jgi:4-amino-4-deoxy-L-arabinose transferase-like glycosyltransferase
MVAAACLIGLIPQAAPAPSSSFTSLTSFTSSASFISLLFGFFLGLAVLAKGPVAIILCGGAALFWALFTNRRRDALRLLHPAAIAAFCLTALPWYILCASRNPDFFRIFIVEHNFKRFLTAEFQHIQPFWFYAEIILIAFLPWTAALLWTLVAGLRRALTGQLSLSTYFLFCWAAFCVVFFTISRSKLPGYILPAVPPIALILSRAATSLAPGKRWSFALVSLAMATLSGCAFVAIFKGGDRLLKNLVAFASLFELILLFLAVANLLLGVFFLFSRRSAAVAGVALSLFLTFPLLDIFSEFTPVSILSPRYVAYQLQAAQVPLAALRVSNLKRATIYNLDFYLRTDLQEWDRDPSREVYVLATGSLPCSKMPEEVTCSNLWGELDKTDSFELLHLTPKMLVSSAPGSRQPQ